LARSVFTALDPRFVPANPRASVHVARRIGLDHGHRGTWTGRMPWSWLPDRRIRIVGRIGRWTAEQIEAASHLCGEAQEELNHGEQWYHNCHWPSQASYADAAVNPYGH
jgi:hypothetical protein